MPGLDGLEVIRKLKEISPATAVILVTGYSDFSYAQEAIRHGVFDYLVKQVKKDELIAALERVKTHLEKSNAEWDWDTYFAMLEENPGRSVRDCLHLLKTEAPAYCCVLTCLCSILPDMPMIRKSSSPGQVTVTIRTGLNKVMMLICHDQPGIVELPAPDETIQWKAIGSSGTAETDNAFYELYRRSEMAMMTAVVQKKNYMLYDRNIPDCLESMLKEFTASLHLQNKDAAILQYHAIVDLAKTLSFDTMVMIANQMVSQIRECRFGTYDTLELHHEMMISTADPIDELFTPIELCLTSGSDCVAFAPNQINRILDYINDHYTEDIKITDLAKHFFLSANYLSILLRRETGATYTEHIISKRIALAKQLLSQTDTPIQDIVEKVGYKEYSCFIKLFKKHTGMTPYAYRKEMQGKQA